MGDREGGVPGAGRGEGGGEPWGGIVLRSGTCGAVGEIGQEADDRRSGVVVGRRVGTD